MQPVPPCPAPISLTSLVVVLRCIFCGVFFFFLQVMLPSEISKLPTDTPVRGFPTVWKLLSSFTTPSLGRVSILNLLSLFSSFIFCPASFWRDWAAFLGAWCPLPVSRSCFVEVAQHSTHLLINLWGRKWSPHLFLCHLGTTPLHFSY